MANVSKESSSEHSAIQAIMEELDKLLNACETRKSPGSVKEGASPKFSCYNCKTL